ncbi:MAG: ABC-2 type transport system permease protein, partial [Acidimicrobiales bacterium]
MASKTILVAQREYLENVRTKTFWIGIFIVPILIAASIGIGKLIREFKEVQKYTVVDLNDQNLLKRAEREFRSGDTKVMFQIIANAKQEAEQGEMKPALKELIEQFKGFKADSDPTGEQLLALSNWMQQQPPEILATFEGIRRSKEFDYVALDELELKGETPEARLEELGVMVNEGDLFAYFILGADPLNSVSDFRYVSNNRADTGLKSAYESALTTLIQKDRIREAKIKDSVAKHIQKRVAFTSRKVNEKGEEAAVEEKDTSNQYAPAAFVYLLWIAIFSIANLLLTNTIEEKSNRIIEVLLSSVSPSQLMNGKIFGIAFTGLTIIGTWVGFALLAAWIAPLVLGAEGNFVKMIIPVLGNIKFLGMFVFYFLGGFLLYAAVLVAIGSVCNTLKEAQNLMQPVVMVLMVPLIAMIPIIQEPNGTVAKVMSFIPLFTPFAMMNRAAGPPELWEYIVTTLIMIATIWFAFKA